MMREQIHRNMPSKWLVALLLPALLSGDRACAQDPRQTGLTSLEIRGVPFELVRIPAGEFVMGCESDHLGRPAHKVRIGYEFEMGRTEVTVAQFRAFVEATGYVTDGEKAGTGSIRQGEEDWRSQIGVDWRNTTFPQSDDDPATFISWNDATAFCRWLSAESGQEIRLPSEAEWEYACRAGTTGDYAGELNAMGWHRHNSGRRTHPVAQKQPNAWGLYDMHGNVWEWCLDAFALNYEGAPADGSPRRQADRDYGVVSRGGSFINPPGWLASAGRMASSRDCSHYNNGLRIVRVVKGAGLRDDISEGREPMSLVPVHTDLPRPIFVGTEKDVRAPRTKPVQRVPGPPFLAPAGTKNVALGKPVSASDEEPVTGELDMITDGDKEAIEGSFIELGPLLQHVTIDLQSQHEIYGIRAWHFHQEPRVYFDVIVQISNDPDFIKGVQTIFNNDMDNSAGLGVGTDMHYVDTSFGEIFDAKGLQGRYVRLHSRGNTANDLNHYIEVEVYGRPADK
jgi:formylglycine-generating enzyme required for sulfatase activity